jgi:hypothetical protein
MTLPGTGNGKIGAQFGCRKSLPHEISYQMLLTGTKPSNSDYKIIINLEIYAQNQLYL